MSEAADKNLRKLKQNFSTHVTVKSLDSLNIATTQLFHSMRVVDDLKRNSMMLADYAEHGRATLPPPVKPSNPKKSNDKSKKEEEVTTIA